MQKVQIKATKRSGAVVEGTFNYDGLSDLWPVKKADGAIAYVSVLDQVESWKVVAS